MVKRYAPLLIASNYYVIKVQQNVLEQRRQEKKRVLDSVKKFTKGSMTCVSLWQ